MERVYLMLQAFRYPSEGIDWLRRRRLLVILVLAVAAWALFIGLAWLGVLWLFA